MLGGPFLHYDATMGNKARVANAGKFLLFVVLAIGAFLILSFAAMSALSGIKAGWLDTLNPAAMFISEVTIGLPVLLATFVMARIERRSVLSYGFSPRAPKARRYFLEGVAIGIVNPAIIAGLMLAFGGMQILGFGLSGIEWIYFPLGWLAVMLLVGFFEEALFRGYALVALARSIGFWPAAVALTALFVLAHAGKMGENWIDFASIAFIGFTMALAFLRTGSLWLAAGFHVAFDYMQFFVIGTKNGSQAPIGTLFHATFNGPAWVNGGALGTEASYFVFPVTLAMLAFVLWRYRDDNEFDKVLVQPDP